MRRVKLATIFIGLCSLLAIGTYSAYWMQSIDAGYCHADERFLSDEEKVRAAVTNLLKSYPPAVIETPIAPGLSSWDFPERPIAYRDVNEFMSLNPDCCKLKPTEAYTEGTKVSLFEKLTGTATSVVEASYLVHYRDRENVQHSIKTLEYLHITNCGAPGKPWSPY